MVTALSSPPDRAKALGLGADAFVGKPFDVGQLIGVLRDLELELVS